MAESEEQIDLLLESLIRDQLDSDEPEELPIDHDKLDRLCGTFIGEFQTTETLRKGFEDAWISDLRQVKGIYHPDIINDINKSPSAKSKTYYKYTRSKERPMVAKLTRMLFPEGENNWDVVPTPVPKLGKATLQEIASSLIRQDEQGRPIPPSIDDMNRAVRVFAKERSEAMRTEISDQLFDMKFVDKGKRIVRDTVRYGTGILKGPTTMHTTKKMIVQDDVTGEFDQKEEEVFLPDVDNVSPWYFFPDMSTTEFDQCRYVYELHPMTRREMRELSKNNNFFADRIEEILESMPKGNYQLKNWENMLTELQANETRTTRGIDTEKYEVIERNGYVDGEDLKEAGLISDDDDTKKEWMCNIWYCGSQCIKATVWPSPINELTDLYHIAYYEKDETSIFGTGLPADIKDSQAAICATVRLMINNGIKSSEPIREINTDLLSNSTTSLPGLLPGELIQREGLGNDAQYPLIRDYKTDNHTGMYLNMLQKMENIGDRECGVPHSMFEAEVADETKRAFVGRAQNVNEVIRDFVKNFDVANESFLSVLYEWNMEYNDKEYIKGDMQIKSIGSTTLLARETQLQGIDSFRARLQPEDWPYINRRDLLREELKLLDLHQNIELRSDDDAENIRQAQVDKEALALAKATQMSDIEYTKSKAAHMFAKARSVVETIPEKKQNEQLKAAKTMDQLKTSEQDRDIASHQALLDTADILHKTQELPAPTGEVVNTLE